MERSEQTLIRLEKLGKLRELGIDPYPLRPATVGEIEYKTQELLDNFEDLSSEEKEVSTAGRIIAIRKHGKSVFMHLQDMTGKIQLLFRLNITGEEKFNLIDYLDIGDYIGVRGILFKTRTGENTMDVHKWDLLAKSLHPLPEKWHGLKDIELRIRKRYLDLSINPETREIFIKRAKIIQFIRDFLNGRNFLEVETPILQALYGGAFATPFTTYHQTMDMELFLRIADELYLKKLIIGDLDRVYEISKNFRNEGIDRTHNPEFTSLELYQAYTDYYGMMELTEELLGFIASELLCGLNVTFNEKEISVEKPFQRVTMFDAVKEHAGIDIKGSSVEALKKYCKDNEIELPQRLSFWKLVEKIFDEKVQPNLIQPTFILDYPIELSPLAKRKPGDPELVERFELFIGGLEIANAFSELNDPIDQRERFERQMELRREGEEETQELDEDFLLAVEHGMPPTGGLGIGIDRLVMLFTDTQSIREVILFPLTRSK